jgi:hypothetical protein
MEKAGAFLLKERLLQRETRTATQAKNTVGNAVLACHLLRSEQSAEECDATEAQSLF